MDTEKGEGVNGTNWESVTDIWTLLCMKQKLVGSCCEARGVQLGAL